MTSMNLRDLNRRHFFSRCSIGLGSIALGSLLKEQGLAVPAMEVKNPLEPKKTHFPAKAKNVIFLFMEGGPSHLDTFDYKPLLNELHGQKLPASFKEPILAMGESGNPILGSKRAWQRHGQSGLWVSDWFPHVAGHADDLAVINSCVSDGINHAGGVCQMNTGSIFGGRPSLGAWVSYGIGTENRNLPGFVVIAPDHTGNTLTDSDPPDWMHYVRGHDVKATIDAAGKLPASDPLAGKLQLGKVFLSGHSYGGHTAGGRLNKRHTKSFTVTRQTKNICRRHVMFRGRCKVHIMQTVTFCKTDFSNPSEMHIFFSAY
jgi:hypothetical protein